jgi:hypothetical protein
LEQAFRLQGALIHFMDRIDSKHDMTAQDWTQLINALRFLKTMYQFTNAISGDMYVTSGIVAVLWNIQTKHYKDVAANTRHEHDEWMVKSANAIIEKLAKYENLVQSFGSYAICILDPRVKDDIMPVPPDLNLLFHEMLQALSGSLAEPVAEAVAPPVTPAVTPQPLNPGQEENVGTPSRVLSNHKTMRRWLQDVKTKGRSSSFQACLFLAFCVNGMDLQGAHARLIAEHLGCTAPTGALNNMVIALKPSIQQIGGNAHPNGRRCSTKNRNHLQLILYYSGGKTTSTTSDGQHELKLYLSLPRIKATHDPLHWWKSNKKTCTLGQRLLGDPAYVGCIRKSLFPG